MRRVGFVKTLLLIRHAHTHMAGRFCGHSDPELSSTGSQQLSEMIAQTQGWPLSSIFTSDLKRAVQTAEAIAAPRNLPIQLRTGLREIHLDCSSQSQAERSFPQFHSIRASFRLILRLEKTDRLLKDITDLNQNFREAFLSPGQRRSAGTGE